jgi:hypothetical protein
MNEQYNGENCVSFGLKIIMFGVVCQDNPGVSDNSRNSPFTPSFFWNLIFLSGVGVIVL